MDKFKKYNEALCEEFCKEMQKFEEHPDHARLKAVKDLAETWADLQCIEAGYAMRKIAEKKYGHDSDMEEWDEEDIYDIYNAATRGGRGRRRDSRGRYMSNRRGMTYNARYDDEYWPPMYNDDRIMRGDMGRRSDREGRDDYAYNNYPYNPNERYIMQQDNGRPIFKPFAKHDMKAAPKRLTKEQIKEWLSDMENEDGTTGPHWNEQQVEQVAQKLGIKFEDFSRESFEAAMNMMYSDYCKTLEKYGANRPEVYACLAKDFLEDEDYPGADGNEKLAAYYFYVLQGE